MTSRLWTPPRGEVTARPDGALIHIARGRRVEDIIRLGPNEVHAFITRRDGTIEDLGVSLNLLTNAGRDLWAAGLGHAAGASGVATGSSATSLTDSGASWTTNQWKGWRVYCPVTSVGTAPVYGNIGSNTGTVLTIDQWWTAADGTGTTPASTNGYLVLANNTARFMALTTDSAAASASDTTLASEITTGGAARALATYAHTAGTNTYTLQKAYSITSTFTNIHKMGLFTASTSTAAGILVFETVLNQDAIVGNGDTLTVTETVTLSG